MRQIPVADFEVEWRRIYDSVFNRALVPDRPFRDETWEAFLLPDSLNMDRDVLASIGLAARQLGDDELVIWITMTQVARSWRVYGVIFRGERLPRQAGAHRRAA